MKVLISGWLALAAAAAVAQEEPAPPPKILITGSNIARTELETSAPVQILTREDISAMGASTLKDVLDKVPGNTGALSDLAGRSAFAAGASGLSLRNLGKSATLVLLNGRRVANFGLADNGRETFVNIDAIPIETIDRVEILLDGASAIYGSDAVAGVVNIITRKTYRGDHAKLARRQSLLNGALDRDQITSLTHGRGDLAADGYNWFGHLELYQRFPYADREIDPAVPQWYRDYVNPNFGVKSTYSVPGNFVLRNPATGAVTSTVPAAGCADIEGDLCRFDQYARLGIHARAERWQFQGGGRLQLTPQWQAFSELSWSSVSTTYYDPPPIMQYTGTPQYWYSSRDDRLKSFTEPLLPATHPYNPYGVPVELRYRFADDPAIYRNRTRSHQYRWLGGLEGQGAGWDWNLAIGLMGARSGFAQRGAKDADAYLQAILSGAYHFGQVNDPALLLKMFPVIEFGGASKQAFADARATRELASLAGGPLALAVGADTRTDSFQSWVSDNVAQARIVGFGSINIDNWRREHAVYAELDAPFTSRFDANLALRWDKIGRTEHSLMPKLGLRYRAADKLLLRASVAGGFRAPSPGEAGQVALSAFRNNVVDPRRCATALQMYQVLLTGNALDQADALRVRDSLGCNSSVALAVVGNPELAPEKAHSLNAGFVLALTRNLSLALDYYRIERRNEINTLSVEQLLNLEGLLPGTVLRNGISADDQRLAARVKALSGQDIAFTAGTLAAVVQRYQNLNKTRVAGIDLDASFKHNAGSLGRFRFNLRGNVQLDYRLGFAGTDQYFGNQVGTYLNYRYQLRATAGWKRGPWDWNTTLQMWPQTSLNSDTNNRSWQPADCAARGIPVNYCRIQRDMTLDLQAVYSGLAHGKITVDLDNVLNRAASADLRQADPVLRGRSLRLAYESDF